MKLASFRYRGVAHWGVVERDAVADLTGVCQDLQTFLGKGQAVDLKVALQAAPRVALTDVEWLPVIPNPGKILCVGLNYDEHVKETGRDPTEQPTIFTRFADTLVGHEAPVILPGVSTSLDYEAELAVIVGKSGRYISRSDAFRHIAGFACFNDATLRDWQRHSGQFTPGKNFPATGPLGPWMVTPDELGEIGPQRIQSRLNGQVMQQARLGDMIFNIPKLIEYCSSFTRLNPGDVIATGTPGGVGMKREPPVYMGAGDRIEVEIEGVGLLANVIRAEQQEAATG